MTKNEQRKYNQRLQSLSGFLPLYVLFSLLIINTIFAGEKGPGIVWIFLRDKGPQQELALQKAGQLLTSRALQRRAKVRKNGPLIDFSDKRVYPPYIEQIRPLVNRIRVRSKWLNAVSVEVKSGHLDELSALPFVLKIEDVAVTRKKHPDLIEQTHIRALQKANTVIDSLDYGKSYNQLQMIGIPALHKKGLDGSGIWICMLDDGFNLLYLHRAFRHLHIVATHDFVDNDTEVDDSRLKATVGWHGTMTLSVIAGFAPGFLIGPAYNASYLLARTEVDASETPVEEDFWVAGLEWADSLGANIVSSSLGYIDWYSWSDMDGKTAVVTIAAEMAVDKGMILFNSAGNEGYNPDHNTLIAPADAQKVLTVAAVNSSGFRAGFSSVGPTADGRIKPDIAAMGSYVFVANDHDTAGFTYGSGTSFSCPLAAGGAALLLQAFPYLTPAQMREILKNTASQASFPDKFLGWGIVNLEKAYALADSLGYAVPPDSLGKKNLIISQNYPNPAHSFTTFRFRVNYPSILNIVLYDVLGEKIQEFGPWIVSGLREHHYSVDLNNLANGVYFYRISARTLGTGRLMRQSRKLVIMR